MSGRLRNRRLLFRNTYSALIESRSAENCYLGSPQERFRAIERKSDRAPSRLVGVLWANCPKRRI